MSLTGRCISEGFNQFGEKMKAATLLKQAVKSKSGDSARKLLDKLTYAFQAGKSKIGYLDVANDDYNIEDDGVFVRVEFNR